MDAMVSYLEEYLNAVLNLWKWTPIQAGGAKSPLLWPW